MARRWNCPPWVAEHAPARYLRMVQIVDMGTPEGGEGEQWPST